MKSLNLYKSKLNLIETERGIFWIKKRFQELLENNLNLLKIREPKYFMGEREVTIENFLNSRSLNFDSVIDYNIYTLYNFQNYQNWIVENLKKLKISNNNGIYSILNFIERDQEIFGKTTFENWDLLLAYKYINSENLQDKAIEITRKIYSIIVNLKKELNIFFPVLKEKIPDKLKIINLEKTNYKNVILEYKHIKENYLKKNKWNFFFFSEKFLKILQKDTYDFNNIEISFFSNYLNLPFELITTKLLRDSEKNTILVKINLDFLALILLEKATIYEIQNNNNREELEEKLKVMRISTL